MKTKREKYVESIYKNLQNARKKLQKARHRSSVASDRLVKVREEEVQLDREVAALTKYYDEARDAE